MFQLLPQLWKYLANPTSSPTLKNSNNVLLDSVVFGCIVDLLENNSSDAVVSYYITRKENRDNTPLNLSGTGFTTEGKINSKGAWVG